MWTRTTVVAEEWAEWSTRQRTTGDSNMSRSHKLTIQARTALTLWEGRTWWTMKVICILHLSALTKISMIWLLRKWGLIPTTSLISLSSSNSFSSNISTNNLHSSSRWARDLKQGRRGVRKSSKIHPSVCKNQRERIKSLVSESSLGMKIFCVPLSH